MYASHAWPFIINMGYIFLVRHGVTDGNYEGILLGRKDYALNSDGFKQAERCAKSFHDFSIDQIYTSPILRAYQTAEILSKEIKVHLEVDQSLTEVDCGNWVGRSYQDLRNLEEWKEHFVNPVNVQLSGWESVVDVNKRSVNFLERIFATLDKKNIIIVSHGDVIRCMLSWALGMNLKYFRRLILDNALISQIKKNGYESQVLGVNLMTPLKL